MHSATRPGVLVCLDLQPTFAAAQGLQAGLAAQSELAALHHQREPGIDVFLALLLQAHQWGLLIKVPDRVLLSGHRH